MRHITTTCDACKKEPIFDYVVLTLLQDYPMHFCDLKCVRVWLDKQGNSFPAGTTLA